MVSSDPDSPHGLDLVIDFVNTDDREAGTDELDSPQALAQWLRARSVAGDSARIRRPELAQAHELRDALRSEMLVHNGSERDPSGAATLEQIAKWGELSVRFHSDGSTRLEPRAGGFAGALASLLVPVALAAGDGTWERVKACRADTCQWVFYDRSRNRSGRWCEMAVCGNRTKVSTYRTKQAGA